MEGVAEGERWLYKNGNLIEYHQLTNDKLNGIFKRYRNGKLLWDSVFKNGKRMTYSCYDQNQEICNKCIENEERINFNYDYKFICQ